VFAPPAVSVNTAAHQQAVAKFHIVRFAEKILTVFAYDQQNNASVPRLNLLDT
jgi:hypothetical protein